MATTVEERGGPSGTSGAAPAASDEARGWYAVVVITIVGMLAQIDRGVLALLVEPIKRDLKLTDTQVSLLIGFAFTFFYMIVGPVVARLGDTRSRTRIMAVGLTIWSVATALCGVAQSFLGLFFARALVGGGESMNGPASMSLVSDCVKRDRLPRAYAILNMGIMAGMGLALVIGGVAMGLVADVAPIPIGPFGVIRNWQLVFLIVGIPGLLLAILLVLTVPEPARRGVQRPGGLPLKEVIGFVWARRAIHLPLFVALTMMSIQNFGLGAWAPAFYQRTYGWSPATIGPILGSVSLVTGPLGLLIGTRLAELMASRRDDANLRVLMLAQLLPIPFGIAGPLMPTPEAAIACAAAAAVLGVMGGASYSAALQIVTPNEMRGQVNALYLFAISALGGAIGPTFVALLTDHVAGSPDRLRYVLSGMRACLGPGIVLLIWLTLKPYAAAYRAAVDAERD
ncbi:MAG: MFS transporter [Sphingomonas fennica]